MFGKYPRRTVTGSDEAPVVTEPPEEVSAAGSSPHAAASNPKVTSRIVAPRRVRGKMAMSPFPVLSIELTNNAVALCQANPSAVNCRLRRSDAAAIAHNHRYVKSATSGLDG